jgi:hypothetical protein
VLAAGSGSAYVSPVTDPVLPISVLAGRYAIERELGHGGMATVYLARDERHQRMVAVKVLRPDLAASIGAERFLREIRIAANLQHPHILTLIDSGADGETLFYVMPFVEGMSLRDRLAGGPLPVSDEVRYLRDVLDALAYAHAHGFVHRDVKPDNVMLSAGWSQGNCYGISLRAEYLTCPIGGGCRLHANHHHFVSRGDHRRSVDRRRKHLPLSSNNVAKRHAAARRPRIVGEGGQHEPSTGSDRSAEGTRGAHDR